MRKNDIFVNNFEMDTQTVFSGNGTISIFPCEYELGQDVMAGNVRQVVQRGRMMTQADGTSRFVPYRHSGDRRYEVLWQDHHALMRMSKGRLVLTVTVPLDVRNPYATLAYNAQMVLDDTAYDDYVRGRIEEAQKAWLNNEKR